MNKKILVVSPWIGEFGWLLMRWQGYVRKQSKLHDLTVVSCLNNDEFYLFRDFARQSIDGIRDCATIQHATVTYLSPLQSICGNYKIEQEFVRYGTKSPHEKKRFVVHARGRHGGPNMQSRNWPIQNWDILCQELHKAYDCDIYAIGSKEESFAMCDGLAIDARGWPLESTANLLASCDLCIGPSSGPMHFASLCGCQHLVWCDKKVWGGGHTSRQRYEHEWNPLKTSVVVLDHYGYQPSPQIVIDHIKEIIR